jgi:hypothetical protein
MKGMILGTNFEILCAYLQKLLFIITSVMPLPFGQVQK